MPEQALESELSGIRALVLDVDDTVVDTRGAMVAAAAVAAAALWPGHASHHDAMAERYYADPARWFRRYAAGEVPFEAMRAGRLEDVAAAFGLDLPDEGHAAFEAAYAPAFRAAQRLFPDVPDLLRVTEELGLPVGLLTNSATAPTRVKLDALGLAERFDAVVTTDTIGVGKPDPRVYLRACDLLGVDAGAAVCIGDSLEWDVHGATRAGLRAVWLDRADGGGPPSGASRVEQDGGPEDGHGRRVVRISSLAEVTAVLADRRRPDLGPRWSTGSIPSRFTSQKAFGRARE